jgi:hypothetical protein
VNSESSNNRRRFLGRMLGTAAAAGLSVVATRAAAAESVSDDWIKEVRGGHRCLFDFPQHRNAYPLLHILNYLNTYSAAYKTGPGEVGAVGTFYSVGRQASIPLAFNDTIWAKCELGAYRSEMRRGRPTRAMCSTGRPARICICCSARSTCR